MIDVNGTDLPCYGTLAEIHAALINDHKWLDRFVTINGMKYTVKSVGFVSGRSGRCFLPISPGFLAQHPGRGLLVSYVPATENAFPYFVVVTTGKIPHISDRCQLCGSQLVESDRARRACFPCYAEELNDR